MTQFICEHPDIVSYSIGILIALLGGSASLIIYFFKLKISKLNSIENFMKDLSVRIEEKFERMVKDHDTCRETLPLRFASTHTITEIGTKLDNISDKLTQFPFVYRTKDEAQREWRAMETRLTSMEGNIKAIGDSAAERHREVWDKLNRVVDMFRDEANKMEQRINVVANHSKREIKEEIL